MLIQPYLEKKYDSFDNISISLIHSIISALLVLNCFTDEDFNIEKLEDFNNETSTNVLKFSYAYFIYDFYDMLRTNRWNPMYVFYSKKSHIYLTS